MDKSFLSDANLIKASRDFVCIRLATYEDEEEAKFLKSFNVGRSADLENTVFVLLTPDGKQTLCKPSRGPNFEFRTPSILASAMESISLAFNTKDRSKTTARLPQMKDFRLGLNVSSCDGLPSVICVGKSAKQVSELQDKLSPLALDEQLAGKFVYASSKDPAELKIVKGYDGKAGFVMIKPGEFGIDGEMISMFAPSVDSEVLKKALVDYANGTEKVVKVHRDHVREGNRSGKNWETEIPVTDPGSLKAMERNQNQRGRGDGRGSSGRSGDSRIGARGRSGGGPPRGDRPPRRGGGQ